MKRTERGKLRAIYPTWVWLAAEKIYLSVTVPSERVAFRHLEINVLTACLRAAYCIDTMSVAKSDA